MAKSKISYMWRHFKTITKHRHIVMRECWACGLYKRGLLHDLSKYSLSEFVSSAQYFQGDRSPIDAEKECCGYSLAWLHHKGRNPHHWEYWIDFDIYGYTIANKIPWEYVIEMICDWIGAGKVYSAEAWTQSEPLSYFRKVQSGRHFHPDTEKLIVTLLELISEKGLPAFHDKVRNPGYLWIDYTGIYCP